MKLFSVICDNASNNDTMIEELANLLDDFLGPANQTRCFLHILNLVVKSIIRQFDLPKSKKMLDDSDADKDDPTLDAATMELLKLAGDIDLEEWITMSTSDDDLEATDDDEEGWVDEHDNMTEDDLKELVASVQPVQLLLLIFYCHAFHSARHALCTSLCQKYGNTLK